MKTNKTVLHHLYAVSVLCFSMIFPCCATENSGEAGRYYEYNELPYTFVFSLDGLKGIIPDNDLDALVDSFVIDHGVLYCADKTILQKYSSDTKINNILKLIITKEKEQDCSPTGKIPQRMKNNLEPFTINERRTMIRNIVFDMSGQAVSWTEPSPRTRKLYTLTDRMYNIVQRKSEAPFSSGQHICEKSVTSSDYNFPADDLLDRCPFSTKEYGIYNKNNRDFSSEKNFAEYAANLKKRDFTKRRLHKYPDKDIDYMLDMLSYAKKAEHLALFEKTLEEKTARLADKASISWYLRILQKRYMNAGMPQKAYELREKYKDVYSIPLPEKYEDQSGGKKGWRAYALKNRGKILAITDTGLERGEHIVVTGYWGSALDSLWEISQSVWLRRVFWELGTVVADGFSMQWQQAWLDSFPIDRIYSVFSYEDMTALDKAESPAFYFLKDGKTVYSFTGIKKGIETSYMGLHFRHGLKALYGKDGAERFSGIEKKPVPQLRMPEERDIPQKEFELLSYPKAPYYLDYGKVMEKAQPWQILKFINRTEIYNGCLAAGNFSGMAQHYAPYEYRKIIRGMDFCMPRRGYEAGTDGNFTMAELLEGISPERKTEFARSIITKNGHIISAYIGGLEQEAGTEKTKQIVFSLTGRKPLYDTVCRISDNADKTVPIAEKGYFCVPD